MTFGGFVSILEQEHFIYKERTMSKLEVQKHPEKQEQSRELKALWRDIASEHLNKAEENSDTVVNTETLKLGIMNEYFGTKDINQAGKLLRDAGFAFTPEQLAAFSNAKGKAEEALIKGNFELTPQQTQILSRIKEQLQTSQQDNDNEEEITAKEDWSLTPVQPEGKKAQETEVQTFRARSQSSSRSSDTEQKSDQDVSTVETSTPDTQESIKVAAAQDTTESLSEDARAKKALDILQQLSREVKQDEGWNVVLNPEQIHAFETIDDLLVAPEAPVGTAWISERTLLVHDKATRKKVIKSLKKEIKAEKKAKSDIRKIAKLEEQLASVKNDNNYYYSKASLLEQINAALDQGIYINTPIAFLKQTPLIVDIYKNRKKIKGNAKTEISSQGKMVDVYNQAVITGQVHEVGNYVQSCGGYANVAEQWLHENTKMSHWQARNAVNTLTTIGMIGAGALVLRWLFTKKWEDGKRKFWFSFSKILMAVGIPLVANFGSQAATGRWVLENLALAWKTGKLPRNNEVMSQSSTVEKMAIGQNMLQFVLLGVPFSTLAQCCSPATGIVSRIDSSKLKTYYLGEIEKAKANRDSKSETILRSQLEALESIISDKDTEKRFSQEFEKMQLQADDLANPAYAQKTLNERLYQNSQAFKLLESYCAQHQLMINEEARKEIESQIFNTGKAPTEADFKAMQEKGLLIPNNANFEELSKLKLSDADKSWLYSDFLKLANKPEHQGMQIKALNEEEVELSSHEKSIVLNMQKLTLDGFKNSANIPIPLGSRGELLRVGLLVNMLRANEEIRGEKVTPRYEDKHDMLRPFDLSHGREVAWKGLGSIVFNGFEKRPVVLSNLIPFFGEMASEFPTLGKAQNSAFFVQYLNQLWKNDRSQ